MLFRSLVRAGGGAVPEPRQVPGTPELRAMMRAVVTGGTAGKTGTAEIAAGAPHAWFIGFRGGLAFAVFVETGGSGPKVAAPLAARFLAALR